MNINPSLISFVASSKRRLEILKILKEQSRSQPELRKLTGMYKTHTSRTIKELVEKNLILCKNPTDRAFKFYKITAFGKRTLNQIEQILEE